MMRAAAHPTSMLKALPHVAVAAFLVAALLAACGGGSGPNPPPSSPTGLSISAPRAGRVLSGTVAVAAAGVGGTAEELVFELAGRSFDADPDGIAIIDTRGMPDGDHALKATASLATRTGNQAVQATVIVKVDNDLPSGASVGPEGGSLRSQAGSYATVPPGSLSSSTPVNIEDLSKEQILARYGVNYEALGLTFLGALDVKAGEATFALPLQVDLAGWAAAVQPGQGVLMFSLGADMDGDGIGELMAVAGATATPDGSVITTPVPRSEVHGFGSGAFAGSAMGSGTVPGSGATSARQRNSVLPGTILTLHGRGFMPGGLLSNVARFGSGEQVLAAVDNLEEAAFNPLQSLELAVPAVAQGAALLRFANLGSGFESEATELHVGGMGGGSQADWSGLLSQTRVAATALTIGRSGVAAQADTWLSELEQVQASGAFAMARNSGLVSASNRAVLERIGSEGYGTPQRALVRQHALLLDAIAASVPGTEPAAELARLLLLLEPAADGADALRGLRGVGPQQDEIVIGDPCPPAGARTPGPTGMGSGTPPGGTVCGSAGGGGPSSGGLRGTGLSPSQAASFGPVQGAIVRVMRPDLSDKLSPFVSVTDANGYFRIPFVAEGEPYVLHAIDPSTGEVATAAGIGTRFGEGVVRPLVFQGPDTGPGAPTATFTVAPAPSGDVEGTWNFRFDASASSDPDGSIVQYIWTVDGRELAMSDSLAILEKGFGRRGTYTIGLAVLDDDGRSSFMSHTLLVEDLPYDYWSSSPELVSVDAAGEPLPQGVGAGPWIEHHRSVSADGRYVAILTSSSHDPSDTNGVHDLYLKDMETGSLTLLSESTDSIWTRLAVLSTNGRYAAFTQAPGSSDLAWNVRVVNVPDGSLEHFAAFSPLGLQVTRIRGVSDDGTRVLVRVIHQEPRAEAVAVLDLETEEVAFVGKRPGLEAYTDVRRADMSADGRLVAFRAAHDLTEEDTNGTYDVYLFDVETGATSLVSGPLASTPDGSPSHLGGISGDGRFVTFHTVSTAFGSSAYPVTPLHVYLKDTVGGGVERVSVNGSGVEADAASGLSSTSHDGRYVVFVSSASNLVPMEDPREDGWGQGELLGFVKDRQTGRIAMISMGHDGRFPDSRSAGYLSLSGDGRYVFLMSQAPNLVSAPLNGRPHIFRVENPLAD